MKYVKSIRNYKPKNNCVIHDSAQKTRHISTSWLKQLLALHRTPINLVVCQVSQRFLILEHASRLYAFSGDQNPTQLPFNATDVPAARPAVSVARPSRTRDDPPQESTPVVDRRPTCLTHFVISILRLLEGSDYCFTLINKLMVGYLTLSLSGRPKSSLVVILVPFQNFSDMSQLVHCMFPYMTAVIFCWFLS